MKSRKIITSLIVILIIIAITIASIVFAENKVIKQGIEEKDRTSVLLVPEQDEDENYTGIVQVYLEMDDGMVEQDNNKGESVVIQDAASVASFQIGLDIYATISDDDINSKIDFKFNDDLQEGKTGVQLAKHTETSMTKTETSPNGENITSTIGEKLNIYYVGTKELNDINSKEPLNVGTITLNKELLGNNATVLITPKSEDENGNIVTTAASIGHNATEINVKPEEDHVEFILNPKESEHEDEPNQGGGSEGETNPGGNNQGENNPGGNNNQNNPDNDDNNGSGDNNSNNNGGNTQKAPSVNTGGNHSVTGIVVAIIILAIIAIAIVILKSKKKYKKSRH